ncbi:MAG TPA: DNA-processing protein DprA [Actinomycetota bacterium]|nr:DNA-processing protein DprA [Actinomycetota bacterium]
MNEAAPLADLLAACETPSLALRAPRSVWRTVCGEDVPEPERLAEAARRAEEDIRALEAFDAAIVDFRQADYPRLLRPLPQPPAMLFVRGRAEVLDWPGVAVVGTRGCTRYGRDTAAAISLGLAGAGYAVISGLARGVDAAAHRAAAEAGAATIAVLGTGIDVTYPPEHAGLARKILEIGCLVSEFPPGTPPRKYHFPQRNRLIAGLARAVVVVEADERSGALITASHALEQGKDVFAVPGAIDARTSRGTNRLIQDGAGLVTCAADVTEALGSWAWEGHREGSSFGESSDLGVPGGPSAVESATLTPRLGAGGAAAGGRPRGQAGGGSGVGDEAAIAPPMREADARLRFDAAGREGSEPPPGSRGVARRVLQAISQGIDDLDSLAAALGEGTGLLSGVLLELEVAGLVERLPGPRFRSVGRR